MALFRIIAVADCRFKERWWRTDWILRLKYSQDKCLCRSLVFEFYSRGRGKIWGNSMGYCNNPFLCCYHSFSMVASSDGPLQICSSGLSRELLPPFEIRQQHHYNQLMILKWLLSLPALELSSAVNLKTIKIHCGRFRQAIQIAILIFKQSNFPWCMFLK